MEFDSYGFVRDAANPHGWGGWVKGRLDPNEALQIAKRDDIVKVFLQKCNNDYNNALMGLDCIIVITEKELSDRVSHRRGENTILLAKRMQACIQRMRDQKNLIGLELEGITTFSQFSDFWVSYLKTHSAKEFANFIEKMDVPPSQEKFFFYFVKKQRSSLDPFVKKAMTERAIAVFEKDRESKTIADMNLHASAFDFLLGVLSNSEDKETLDRILGSMSSCDFEQMSRLNVTNLEKKYQELSGGHTLWEWKPQIDDGSSS